MGLPDLMKEIIAPSGKGDVERAILSITDDDSLLINQFSPESIVEVPSENAGQPGAAPLKKTRPIFDGTWAKLQKAGILKTDAQIGDAKKAQNKRNQLYKFVDMKYTIAEYIWNILTGLLVTSVSYNYILNSACQKSPEEMKKNHDAFQAAEKQKIANKGVLQANQPKYVQST